MDREQVLQEFRDAGALLHGHFVLSSGLHSPVYLQCARVMMEGARGERLCAALAAKVGAALGAGGIDMVVSPAMGGVVVGYEMGRQLGVEAIFAERVEGAFTLRRGFSVPPGARVLVVEDVVTTGKSSGECIDCVAGHGGAVVAVACLIDRGGDGRVDLGVPVIALATLDVPIYPADELPGELAAIPVVKPSSRTLR